MSSADAVRHLLVYLNNHYFHRDKQGAQEGHPLFISGNRINARYAGFRLDSLYEPVVDLNSGKIVGHEALLNLQNSGGTHFCKPLLAADALFPAPTDSADITHIDRLTRTLHALNFLIQEGRGDLHLNVHSNHLLTVSSDHGRVFEEILRRCGLAPTSFVLEVVEFAVRDRVHLRSAIGAWQEKGYRLAIDGFGRNHIQVGRVLALQPDLIKFDPTLLEAALQSTRHRKLLGHAVAAARDQGIGLIATGVASEQQHELVRGLGIERAQGPRLGAPQAVCRGDEEAVAIGG
jgi:EAL domain-containing protein (putative c-di-GMP-specific phosphodiesterase class I)